MLNIEETSRRNQEALDLMVKNYETATKGFQAIATEAADYSKKAFEGSVAHLQKLSGVRSVEQVVELQTNFIKSSYEGYIAEATKLGGMYSDIAKNSFKPLEGQFSRIENTVQANVPAVV